MNARILAAQIAKLNPRYYNVPLLARYLSTLGTERMELSQIIYGYWQWQKKIFAR